jgi:pimeloyl-ACP methyl ester carboxylesterase
LAATYQNLREEWIICGGLPIHFRTSNRADYPDGPTLIHLHGFGISGSYLLPTADVLAKDFRSYVPDLPGYGRSIHPERVLSISDLAESVVRFMDAVGVHNATLIGNSMGCIVAIETARIVPERIDRLVLVSPAGGTYNRPIFKGVAQLALDGLRESPRMFTIAVPDYLRFGLLNAGRLFWQMIHYPTVERFQDTQTESLVIVGERDPLVSERRIVDGTEINNLIQIVRIGGAAHAINYSHPAKLAHLIRAFIQNEQLEDDGVSKGTAVVLRRPVLTADQTANASIES